MTWVLRQSGVQHACHCPVDSIGQPPGRLGDLWRCDDCGELWRVARACRACEVTGGGNHGGLCVVGNGWRPASWWQRVRHRPSRSVTLEGGL